MKGIRKGADALARQCPDMARALEATGRPPSRKRQAGYGTLVRIIVDQQVSVHAGAAIWRKLETGLGQVTPETVLAAGEGGLRQHGFSRPKAHYACGLAQAIVSGELDLDALGRKRDNAAIHEALTAIKGIGDWTAEIYLMFALGRVDVWPAKDLALAISAQRLLGLEERPTPKEMIEIGERWRPWRTIAALILWRYYRHEPATLE